MSFTHHDEIRLLGNDLFPDETLPNVQCPECKGGHTHEKSFSITSTDDGFIYNCYRASCNMLGFVPAKGKVIGFVSQKAAGKPHIVPKKVEYKTFTKPTFKLTVDQYAWFQAQFGLTTKEIQDAGVSWCPETRSYIFPIYNRYGSQVGTVDRSWMGRSPKAITYGRASSQAVLP